MGKGTGYAQGDKSVICPRLALRWGVYKCFIIAITHSTPIISYHTLILSHPITHCSSAISNHTLFLCATVLPM